MRGLSIRAVATFVNNGPALIGVAGRVSADWETESDI